MDGRLLAVITLHDGADIGGDVHVEAFFGGEAPDMFETLDVFERWLRSTRNLVG